MTCGMRPLLTAAGLALSLAAASGQTVSPADRCSRIAAVKLTDASVTVATLIPAGAAVSGVKLPPAIAARVPAFCRVQVTDRPSSDSDIRIELWLPTAAWNGRFRGTGNGGFAGEIYFGEMAAALAEGYAVAGTDTGHVGGEGTFALGHPEKVKDFGWRAIHDMTVDSKALLQAFYGRPAAKAYFAGCSDGGREALMEAERFPEDYDGILAGAPAYNWTGLVSGGAAQMQALFATSAPALPYSKIPALAAAVNAACDPQDGVRDGVINDPRQCGFDPATLVCKTGDAADCLTPAQAATVKRIYAGVKDASGNEVISGLLPGGEGGANGWAAWVTGTPEKASLGAFFPVGYFANFVEQQPGWTLRQFHLDKDLKLAREKTAADLDARDTNLKPFTGRGGKLILYHGWNDPAIPARGTVEYFESVRQALGSQATTDAVRLYMVPGMQHCGGGPGATEFGQNAAAGRGDAGHDVFTALEEWVEAGQVPGQIAAWHYSDQRSRHGEEFGRPLCPYPAAAKYLQGDTADAKSFACVKP